MTMQSDINGVLLKMKTLQDAEENHTQFREFTDQIVKQHADRIDQAVDDLDMQN